MNPVAYYQENKEEPAFYECGNCKRLFYDKEKAEQCCKPIICSNCGREISQDRTKPMECVYGNDAPLCFSCWDKQRIAKQEVWTEDVYDQKNKDNNYIYSYVNVNDNFYSDLYEAVSDLASDGLTEEEIKNSLFYVCQETQVPKINIERELENVEEQMALEDVDSETIWKDLQELRDFVKQWNDKQDYTYYETTDIQVVPNDKLIKDCIEEYKD